MLNDWTAQLRNTKAAATPFGEANPQMLIAYRGLNAAHKVQTARSTPRHGN